MNLRQLECFLAVADELHFPPAGVASGRRSPRWSGVSAAGWSSARADGWH